MPQKSKGSDGKKSKTSGQIHELNRLSLLLTLAAILFFTGAVWALGRKGTLNSNDSLILIGLFLFWQCFHVVEVMKTNVRSGKSPGWLLSFDLIILAICAYATYISINWLVTWVPNCPVSFIAKNPGWLSGWLMVLPNAVLAFYYGARGQPETVYASQVGDCHVSIPLCLGVYTMFHDMAMPPLFYVGMWILLISTMLHVFFVTFFGRLPRLFGLILVAAYGCFLWKGLLG